VQAVSPAAIAMVSSRRAPRAGVVGIVRLHTLGPSWLRALAPLHRHRPTGSPGAGARLRRSGVLSAASQRVLPRWPGSAWIAGAVQHRDVMPGQVGAACRSRGCPARRGTASRRVGWLALTTNRWWACLPVTRNSAAPGWVCSASVVTTTSVRSRSASSGWKAGTSPGARRPGVGPAPRGWRGPSRPAAGPAGRRGVWRPQRLAVDRDRPPPLLLAGTVGKPRAEHRRQRRWVHAGKGPTDGGLGGHHPVVGASRRAPNAARTGWGASAAHSAIAAIDRAPVKTAAAAMARIATRGWRRPLAHQPDTLTERRSPGADRGS
jgi:hypothetical protein